MPAEVPQTVARPNARHAVGASSIDHARSASPTITAG